MEKAECLRDFKFTQWMQLPAGDPAGNRGRKKEGGKSMGENAVRPVIFAVSGYKNTGKTTLITAIVPILVEKGYQVAVIKHDGHEFESDVPGTDSYQHQKAGAYGTAVFSKSQFLVTKRVPEITAEMLLPFFPEADIILIEGLKDSSYPKYICTSPQENATPDEVAERILELLPKGRVGETSSNK